MIIVSIMLLPAVCPASVQFDQFDWFIKDAPPTGPPLTKVRTTGYYFTVEEDWPTWYTGAKPEPDKNSCTVPKNKMGFFEDVLCEGTGFTTDGKLIGHTEIKQTREETVPFMKSPDQILNAAHGERAPYRPKRTVALNLYDGQPCKVQRFSRVYLKFPQPEKSKFTGWYIAEDTGGGFKKCDPDDPTKIDAVDIFLGIGKPSSANNPTVSGTDKSTWPEIWIFPPKDSKEDLWKDNILTFLMGMPSSGLAPSQESPEASGAYRPDHPLFSVPYSVNPSFSVSVPFDFSIYDIIPGYFKRLERCKDDLDCILGNVSIIERENPSYNWIVSYAGNVKTRDSENNPENLVWESFCEKPNQHAVNSIAEALDSCSRSQDRNCACKYDLPVVSKDDVNKWYGRAVSAGLFLIPGAGILGLTNLALTELSSSNDWEKRSIVFWQRSKQVQVEMIPLDAAESAFVPNANFKEVDSSIRGTKSFELQYGRDAKSVLLYKDAKNNISILPDSNSYTECQLHNKIIKFCIVQNKSILAYDSKTNKMGIQQLVLRFGYLFKAEVTDVTGFEVRQTPYSTNQSLLVWDEMPGVDVASYNIYYSANPGMDATLRDLSPSTLTPELAAEVTKLPPLDPSLKEDKYILTSSLLSPECIVEGQMCRLKYLFSGRSAEAAAAEESSWVGETTDSLMSVAKVELSPGTLYYSVPEKKFFYLLPNLVNDQEYFFAITATDNEGAESPSFNLPKVKEYPRYNTFPAVARIVSGAVEGDKMAVVIENITKNIEGSEIYGSLIKKYRIFCFPGQSMTSIDISNLPSFENIGNAEPAGDKTKLYFSHMECLQGGAGTILVVPSLGAENFFKGSVSGDGFVNFP